MRKILPVLLLVIILWPTQAFAQSTPSAVISFPSKQATPAGLVNEKRLNSLNSFLVLLKTALARVDKIDQKIAARLTKLSALPQLTSIQRTQINSQQKEIADTLEILKKDLNKLELQSQAFATVSLSKSDFLLYRNQLKNLLKSLNNIHKQEIGLTNDLKKLVAASDTSKNAQKVYPEERREQM